MDVFLSPPCAPPVPPSVAFSSATTGDRLAGGWNALTLGGGGAIAGCGACACINVGCRSPAGGVAKPSTLPRPLRGAGCSSPAYICLVTSFCARPWLALRAAAIALALGSSSAA